MFFLFLSRGERIFRYSDLVAEHVGRVSLIPLGAMMIDVMLGNCFFYARKLVRGRKEFMYLPTYLLLPLCLLGNVGTCS